MSINSFFNCQSKGFKKSFFFTHGAIALFFMLILVSCESEVSVVPPSTDDDTEEQSYTSFDELDLPETPFNYSNITLPAHFQRTQVVSADNEGDNQITDAGATLGRVLFYDKSFSANNSISCASCHAPASGFSDPLQFSEGFEGGQTGRNSMGLSNARYYANGKFFWDERAETLEDQVLMPIQDPVEMGTDLDELVTEIQAMEYYPYLFEQAFGDHEITSERISLALSQFVRSIVSYESPYDQGRATVATPNDEFPNFTALENQGKALFLGRAGCARCHQTDLFILPEARNIGLAEEYTDNGLGDVTGLATDNGKFKAPSLRNIELTAPYMHDGRFATLAEVVEHYNSGIQDHPNLAPQLRPGGNLQRLNLTETEKSALVAFLQTLTDPNCINEEKYADPFR
ncbi:MAG: cytochrome-c peroxidase [Flammeovirgaceae bacterium]